MRAAARIFLFITPAVCVTAVAPSTARAQQPQPAAPPGTAVDASAGGVTISSGVNSLTIGARAQIRWSVDKREAFDADRAGSGVGAPDAAFSQFDVARMRFSFSGGAFEPWLKYQFSFDVARTNGEGASKVKDAFVEFRPTGSSYRMQVGQLKAPFSLQQLTSSGRQQFVDRAITDSKFAPGRDTGVLVGGVAANRKFGYEGGVFNGSGEGVRQMRASPLFVVRVFADPLGPYSPSEGGSDAGDKPVVHVGFGVRGGAQIRGRTLPGVVNDADNQRAMNVEFAYRAPRFFSTAEAFWMNDEQKNPIQAPDVKSMGFHAEAGVMIVPRRVDVAIRFAQIEGDTSFDDAAVSELRGAGGYYWRAHNLKVQADIGRLRYDAGFNRLSARAKTGLPAPGTRLVSGQRLSDTELRLQFQLTF